MKDLLFFETMITPKIITLVYWLLVIGAVIGGFVAMFSGYGGFTFGRFLIGLLTMIGGVIGARIWCELLIVLFKIHENLKRVADKQA